MAGGGGLWLGDAQRKEKIRNTKYKKLTICNYSTITAEGKKCVNKNMLRVKNVILSVMLKLNIWCF